MRFLFIPHDSFERPFRQREHYLIEKLSRGNDVHVLSWTYRSVLFPERPLEAVDLRAAIRGLSMWKEVGDYTKHHIRRAVYPPFMASYVNQAFFRSALSKVVKQESIDVVVLSPSSGVLGFPGRNTGVPVVFDYNDYIDSRQILARYLQLSSAVTCCSKSLMRDVSKNISRCYYLPNGLDVSKFSNARGEEVRRILGIDRGTCLIGLLGATASEDLYYMRASKFLSRLVGDFAFLIVGTGPRVKQIRQYSEREGIRSIFTGWVQYEEIEKYFAATDIGIYPGDHSPFFEVALPIKVLEFSAVRRPVVSANLEELRSVGFPNVFLSEPDEKSFAEAIGKAYGYRGPYPDLTEYDWSRLASELQAISESLVRH